MRILPRLSLALCLLAAAPLPAASLVEKQEPHDVELEAIVERPIAFQGMRVRFTCTFVQTADLFDTFHTDFTPERYLNLVVWDDEDRIWEPEVRAQPVTTLYYAKSRPEARQLSSLDKYTLIEVTGEVVSAFRGDPWIDCHSIVFLPSRGSFSDNAIYHLEQARALVADGAHDLADQHYRAALDEDLPVQARSLVLRLLAESRIASGRYEGAIEILDEVLALSGQLGEDAEQVRTVAHHLSAQALSELAEDRLEKNDREAADLFERAIAHARRSIELDPSIGDAYAILGVSLAGLERFDEAKLQCQRAIRLLPENAEVRWYLGRILARQGDHDAAIESLKDAIDRAPKDYRLHKTIARTYLDRAVAGGPGAENDLVTALREYDIAIRLEPDDADLHYWSGIVILHAVERGQKVRDGLRMVEATKDMAIQRFENCVAVDDAYVEAHLELGELYAEKEEHEDAVEHYQRALALDPDREELYSAFGRYLWDLGRRQEAYDVFAAYQQRHERHVETLYALGRLSLELGERERAIDWLERLRREDDDHAMAHADLAELYYETGDPREAIEHGQRALQLLDDEAQELRVNRFIGLAFWALDQPEETVAALDGRTDGAEDPRVPLALGWALTLQDGQAERVQALAEQALAIDPDNASAKELLGWGRYLAGRYQEAVATLAEAGIADEEVRHYRIGMALFQQGPEHYGQALEHLERARRVNTRPSILREARHHVSQALRTLRDWERDQERRRREAERQAEIERRQAEIERRKAERAAELQRRKAEREAELRRRQEASQ